MPVTRASVTAHVHNATAPANSITRRCSATWPATMPASPRRAARLKTFEPITTPAPTCWSWRTSAVTAAVISGASAASAASIPSNASESPRRAPTRSSLTTSTQLVTRLIAAASTKAAPKTGSDTRTIRRRQ